MKTRKLDGSVVVLDDVELEVVLDVELLDVEVVDVLVLVEEVDELDVLVDVEVVELVDVEVLDVDDDVLEEVDEVLDVELLELDVDDVLVLVEEVDELDVLIDVEVVELVDVDVEDELVDDELLDVLVVVAWLGLHCAGSGLTNSGTATASMQSVLKVATQSTQATTSCASAIVAEQAVGSNVVTAGQVLEKPIAAGVRSAVPPHTLSVPPQAAQMVAAFFVSAFQMRSIVLPAGSPGLGQSFACRPFRRRSQHFCNAFERATMNFDVAWPIACWHLLTALLVPNSPGWNPP
jgi:hypothetical protein